MKKRMFEVLRDETDFPVAKDYEQRAKKIIRHFLNMMRSAVETTGGKFKEPTPKLMNAFVDELPGMLNWAAHGAHKNGIAAPTYSNLPLTEEQMCEVEQRISGAKVVTIENDKTKRKLCCYVRRDPNDMTILTDKKEIVDIAFRHHR